MSPHEFALWTAAGAFLLIALSVSIAVAALSVRAVADAWRGRKQREYRDNENGQVPPSDPTESPPGEFRGIARYPIPPAPPYKG